MYRNRRDLFSLSRRNAIFNGRDCYVKHAGCPLNKQVLKGNKTVYAHYTMCVRNRPCLSRVSIGQFVSHKDEQTRLLSGLAVLIYLCNKLSLEQAFTVRVLAAIAVLIYDAKIRCLGRTPGISVKALSEKAGFSVFTCETPPRPDVRQEWITKQIVSSRKRTRFFYSAGWK